MYKYDITIHDCNGISLLTKLLKKSIHMTMTVPIVVIHVLQMLLEIYATKEILIIVQKI